MPDSYALRLLSLAAVLLLTACGSDEGDIGQTEEGGLTLGRAEVEQTVERGVVFGNRTLVLEGFSGRVDLEGADVEVARLQFVKQGRGEDAAAAREVLSGIEITERGGEAEYVYSLSTEEGERTSVAVEGRVPPTTPARINLESGPVRLSGVQGPLSVETSGPIAAAGVGEDVDLTTRTGDLLLGLRRLPAEAESRLETNNGDITVVLPAGTSVRVEAQTGAGEIRVEGLAFTNRQLSPEGAGASFRGQLGSGNALLELQTQNGTIVLRQGTLFSLPAEEAQEQEEVSADTPAAAWPRDTSLRRAQPTERDTAARDTTGRDTSRFNGLPIRRDTTLIDSI